MKKKDIIHITPITLIILMYMTYANIYIEWNTNFNKPFGIIDIDRYMPMFNNPKGILKDPNHSIFINSINYTTKIFKTNPSTILTHAIPACIWIVFPMLFLLLSYAYSQNIKISIISTGLTMFATEFAFMGMYTAIWSQYLSLIPFYIGIMTYISYKRYNLLRYQIMTILSLILSSLIHTISMPMAALFLILTNIKNKKIIIAGGILIYAFMTWMGRPITDYTILSGKAWEPTPFAIYYILICPILYGLIMVSKRQIKYDLQNWIYVMFIVGTLSHLTRGLPYVLPFIGLLAAYGYYNIKKWQKIFVIIMIFLYFSQVYVLFGEALAFEIAYPEGRKGLDLNKTLEILHIENALSPDRAYLNSKCPII